METPMTQLKRLLDERYVSEDGDEYSAVPKPGLTDGKIDELAQQLLTGQVPPEIRELLKFSSGFEFFGVDEKTGFQGFWESRMPTIQTLLGLVMVTWCLFGCSRNEADSTITISGDVPFGAGSEVTFYHNRNGVLTKTVSPITDEKFRFDVDSLDEGIHALSFSWPKSKNTSSIKRELGEDRLRKARLANNVYLKNLYIDPKNAKHYEIKPERPIETAKVMAFAEPDLRKRDVFRLRVYASSPNTDLFERVDSIGDFYSLTVLDRLQDSLYNNRKNRDMKPYEFIWEAERLQDTYDTMRNETIRKIIWDNLSMPVIPCLLLQIQDLDEDLAGYRQLYDALPEESKSGSCARQLETKLRSLGQ